MSELITEAPRRPIAESELTQQERQQAFLLWQLLQAAPDHRLGKGEANRIPAERKRQLDLNPALANQLRGSLVEQQYIRVEKEGRSVFYALTEAGREYLQSLGTEWLDEPEDDPFAEVNETALQFVRPYLLLQIARKDPEPVKKGDVNRFDAVGEKELGLKSTLANRLRAVMAREGFIEIEKSSRSESYRITPQGMQHLATHDQFPSGDCRLSGKLWNHLLSLAAGTTQEAEELVPPLPDLSRTSPGVPEDLPGAVLSTFNELLRERHAHTGLVPIHEVRARILAEYGEEAASHGRLDEAVRQLQRDGQVLMAPLDHGRDVTEQEIIDSIKGLDRTFFYLQERRNG